MADLLFSQLTDVFRIGMIVALIATALRTRATMGMTVPLLAGVVFVAAIIPMTMQTGSEVPLLQRIGVGIVANLILLGICLGVWEAFQRLTRK
ncbi:MAG: hypothetical protein ACRC6I_00220 [Paracoccaceae bacterium]